MNVVFILVDDWGWTDAACFGSDLYDTPNIDRLTREGMRFTNAYAAHPVCGPSRMAIMSGKTPTRLMNLGVSGDLAASEVTIAEALKQRGYSTFFAGKWHIGGGDQLPPGQGFDESVGATSKGQPSSYFFPYKSTTGISKNRDVPDLADGKKGDYLNDALTDKAVDFIGRHKADPFLVYFSHYAVHTPLEAKEAVVKKYEQKLKGMPAPSGDGLRDEVNNSKTTLAHRNPTYAAMVESLDDSVGRVMDALELHGIADRTMIVLTSDHGALSTARQGLTKLHGITSNAPLRAGKGWCYEGGVRVPLVVKLPGVTEAGATCESPVVGMDHYPTILDALGLPLMPKQHVDGVSMKSLLMGEASTSDRFLYWNFPNAHGSGTPGSSGLRMGKWKIVTLKKKKPELYDLSNDIGETMNLADKFPEVVAGLLKRQAAVAAEARASHGKTAKK